MSATSGMTGSMNRGRLGAGEDEDKSLLSEIKGIFTSFSVKGGIAVGLGTDNQRH